MAALLQTILLDTILWDAVLDVNGNIAIASAPYAVAQDAASAIRTFQSEVYYDTTVGVDYAQILDETPPIELVKESLVTAALTVPDAAAAQCFISSTTGRTLSGQVQVTDVAGGLAAANF